MIQSMVDAARRRQAPNRRSSPRFATDVHRDKTAVAASQDAPRWLLTAALVLRALRPAHWLKNGLVFAGLVFGGKLLDPDAVARASLAAMLFCLLSSGFYVLNDIRDMRTDRLHPVKRSRPIAAGELSPATAAVVGVSLVVLAILGAVLVGPAFLLVVLAYAGLMAAYNLGLKQIVVIDVFVIAAGFVLRAAGGAIAVGVSISSWLLICTMLLALLLGFGKRRYELVALEDPAGHRSSLEMYSERMLDQAVAVTAAGTLIAYAIYTLEGDPVSQGYGLMITIPIVAYGVFRYLHLVYQRGQGGNPETMLVADRALLIAVALWGAASAVLLYLSLG